MSKSTLLKVDDLIAPTIQLLNQKNYITAGCCSGHAEYNPCEGYIQYDFGEMTPETLPDGWFWKEDGGMFFECGSKSYEEQERRIGEIMDALYKWAQGLPDAH